MVNRYEEPGQRLVSHNWSEEYKENHERIFGKKDTWLERREREKKEQLEKEKKEQLEKEEHDNSLSGQ